MPQTTLTTILKNIQPAREAIFGFLSATSVSTLCFALDIKLGNAEKDRYLALTRDFGRHGKWMEDEIRNGHEVMLVGLDLVLLVERITDPRAYWTYDRDYWVELDIIGNYIDPKRRFLTDLKLWVIVSRTPEEKEKIEKRRDSIVAKIEALDPNNVSFTKTSVLVDREPDKWLPEEKKAYKKSNISSEITTEFRLERLYTMHEELGFKIDAFKKPDGIYRVPPKGGKNGTILRRPNSNEYPSTQSRGANNTDWAEQTVSKKPDVTLLYYDTHYFPHDEILWVPGSIFRVRPHMVSTWVLRLDGIGLQRQSSRLEYAVSELGLNFPPNLSHRAARNRQGIDIRVRLPKKGIVYVRI